MYCNSGRQLKEGRGQRQRGKIKGEARLSSGIRPQERKLMNFIKAVHLSRDVNAVVGMPPLAEQCCLLTGTMPQMKRLL